MKKVDFSLFNTSRKNIQVDVVQEISRIAKKFSSFNKNINEIMLKPHDYNKYGSILLQSAYSYCENEKNKNMPIKKLIRTKDFNTLEIEIVYPNENFFEFKENTIYPILDGIDTFVWNNDNINVKRNISRKQFLQFAINAIKTQKYNNFFLSGATNTGKTFLATQFVKNIYHANPSKTIVFINWNQWISSYKMSFNSSLELKRKNGDVFLAMQKADFLFFDDFALPHPSDWERESILLPLLKYRKQKKLFVGLISTLTENELIYRMNPNSSNKDRKKPKFFSLDGYQVFTIT